MNESYRGKLVILFIFGLSAVMGGYAWWHHFNQGRKCLELWGGEAAALIRYAPVVEAMRFGGASEKSGNVLQIAGKGIAIEQHVDVSGTPGLVHARHALIEDASFLWKQPVPTESVEWTFALRFVDGEQRVTIAFDEIAARVHFVEAGKDGILTQTLRDAYQQRIPAWIEASNSVLSTEH
ncbi:MAG: hypothetical protein CMJ64_14905 [Planctomycetaceae bacterium]|nr:hypothetical protein [Planctomycetaceae bacterium]